MSHFNNVANTWDTEEKIIQNKKYAEAIFKLTGKSDFKNILEIGCGTGLLSSNFINENVNFLGVDTSTGMLDVFNQKFHEFKNVNGKLINLEKDHLNLENIDLVISSMAFHHLEKPFELLKKLIPHLATNAMITFIDLDQEDGTFHPDPKNMGVFHFGFSEKEVRQWAMELGNLKLRREVINTVHKNDKQYPICLNVISK